MALLGIAYMKRCYVTSIQLNPDLGAAITHALASDSLRYYGRQQPSLGAYELSGFISIQART